MSDPKGKEKGKGKGSALASASASTSVPVPKEESHTSQQRQDQENLNGQVDTSQTDTSLLSRIGASASGLARDTFVGEGARGDAARRGVEGLVSGKGGSGGGSGSQEFSGGYAGEVGSRGREREVGGGQEGTAGEKGESIRAHIQRNEEEFSTFLDGAEGSDGGFGDGVDSMEFQDENGGDSAIDLQRDFESRDKYSTRVSGAIENSGMLDITSESGGEERNREYRDPSETPHSIMSRNPLASISTPREWEDLWSQASDTSTPTSNSTAQRPHQPAIQYNTDGTVLKQSAQPSTTTPTLTLTPTLAPQTDILAQESHDGEDVLAILNTRVADGELYEQGAMEREMERYGEEGYWEKMWGLDGEQRRKIVGMVRGLERGFKSNGLLELVPDYERGEWEGGGGKEEGGEMEE
ncbi:hypothetical protein EYC80_007863 [Monilinia laxa]|uniref:Uncharacterized protein n=1 Tax=Monilinia laxa TaxID=61186 RepID=A0A5N6JSS2_MONLA|nr:hypothetical protein EYC80_007863 [Monilinia laxa]